VSQRLRMRVMLNEFWEARKPGGSP
jgi:hypothetical protein